MVEMLLLTHSDPQVQPCKLEDTVQCTGVQGPEADIGHICLTGGR